MIVYPDFSCQKECNEQYGQVDQRGREFAQRAVVVALAGRRADGDDRLEEDDVTFGFAQHVDCHAEMKTKCFAKI